jgi:uncharacterized repeat protein (TIGR01451 family)
MVKIIFILIFIGGMTQAKVAEHLVINMVASSGQNGEKDEFIQLYNPTFKTIKVNNLELKIKNRKKTLNFIKDVIPPFSYFLLASEEYSGKNYDATFTSDISDESSIAIFLKGKLVDLVGFGNVEDYETAPCEALKNNKMLKRKICFLDSNNNQEDFILQEQETPKSFIDEPFIPSYAKASSEIPIENKALCAKDEFIYKYTTVSNTIKEAYGIYTADSQEKFATCTSGGCVFYPFQIVNTANRQDTFIFEVESDFDAVLVETKTSTTDLHQKVLKKGEIFNFYVKVNIPQDAILGEEAKTIVTIKNKQGKGDILKFIAKTKVEEGITPNVELTKEVNKPICENQEILTYTITVKNKDNVTLTNISVIDELPDRVYLKEVDSKGLKVRYFVGDSWQDEFSYHAKKVKIIIPEFKPQDEYQFIIKVKVY